VEILKVNFLNWSLKSKFLAITFLILLIPLASIGLLKDVEKTLVTSAKNTLLLASNLISLQLSLNPNWFEEIQIASDKKFIAPEFFIFPLNQSVKVDGFLEEWQLIEKFRQEFSPDSTVSSALNRMALLLGSFNGSLYVSLKVNDNNIIYAKSGDGYRSDQLVITFKDEQNNPRRILISPTKPGHTSIQRHSENAIVVDSSYTAYWAETDKGFNLEIKFPQNLKPKELRVTHYNIDQQKQSIHKNRVTSSSQVDLNPLVWPSQSIIQFIEKISLSQGQRLWVLDKQGRSIARKGSLDDFQHSETGVSGIAGWILSSKTKTLSDQRNASTKLNSTVVYDSLKGNEASMIESVGSENQQVALVSTPILLNSQVIGAVFIEENMAPVQLMRGEKFGELFNVLVILLVVIILLVLGYISKISTRVTQLKIKINRVVDEQGRINTPIEVDYVDGDEIDELSNAFAQMSNKLYDYNDYLEQLAARLSHEIRTPIAIVRSSLDNLLINTSDQQSRETIRRAMTGTQRLGEIISRMRQASGVKSAMQTAQFDQVDFCVMLNQLVNGFSSSFPEYQFRFYTNQKSIIHSVSTDLMAELLDKLLSNAMDFSDENSEILIELINTKSRLVLSVSNKGKTIAKKDLKRIFKSLISIRDSATGDTPNLGLGLYVVRLIGNFHHAKVKAENMNDNSGVKFSVIWKQ